MDFMKTAKYWIGLSLVVTAVGLISLIFRGLNLGIDFTGGTLLDLKFDQPQTLASVRGALGTGHENDTIRLASADGRQVLVTTVALSEADRLKLFDVLKAKLGKFEPLRVEQVQGVISHDLTRQALIAVLIASALQVVYITFRFEFKFAVTAIIALLHDAVIVLGLFSIFRAEVSAPFVAAVLTILGYSLMDTIVIFDRIRENLKLRKRAESLHELVNKSVRQSLTRSIYTSVTTLMAILAVLVFGGQSTRDFALALFLGIVSGTYSSIFVASPLWLWWRESEARGRGDNPRQA